MNINTGTMEHIISLVEGYKKSIDAAHKVRMYEVQAQALREGPINLTDTTEDLEILASTTIARLTAYLETAELHKDRQ